VRFRVVPRTPPPTLMVGGPASAVTSLPNPRLNVLMRVSVLAPGGCLVSWQSTQICVQDNLVLLDCQ